MELIQAKENYILRNIGGSHVLISVGANIANFNGYIRLNDTAAFIWEQLRTPHSCDELSEAVEKEFDIDHETAAADVRDFIAELKENNMVNVNE